MKYDAWYKSKFKKLVNDCGLEKDIAEDIISNYSVSEIDAIIKFLCNYGNKLVAPSQ